MNFREIQQLQNRIEKIRKVKIPPRPRRIVLNPGEKEPEDLCVKSTNSEGEVEMVRDPIYLVIQMEEKKDPPSLS